MKKNVKKILVLGANVTECFIVEEIHKMGMYAIVTDNNKDIVDSPAKLIADESWDISWSDINMLESKCRQSGVDGVIAGFSEFRVENQIKLCSRLGLHCPISMEQLEITRDKIKFKEECKKVGLPIVPEYTLESAEQNLPVIVKPVDRAGSIGINVVHTKEQLARACKEAFSLSPSKKIIIEKYMEGCMKFDVYYFIKDGDISLLTSNDTLMCPPVPGHEILQSAWLFPSKYQNIFEESHSKQIREFISNVGIKNGYLTISAFMDDQKNFHIFEMGFRLSGDLSFKYTEQAYGFNYIDNLLQYAVDGQMPDFDVSKSSTYKLLVINHYAWDGEIKHSNGLSDKGDGYVTYDYLHNRSVLSNKMGNGVSKIAMSFINMATMQQVLDSVDKINQNLQLLSNNGQNLIYNQLDNTELKKFIS